MNWNILFTSRVYFSVETLELLRKIKSCWPKFLILEIGQSSELALSTFHTHTHRPSYVSDVQECTIICTTADWNYSNVLFHLTLSPFESNVTAPMSAHLILATHDVSFQNYVPTVFENYTASFEIDKQRIELNMWDTSGKACARGFGFNPLSGVRLSCRCDEVCAASSDEEEVTLAAHSSNVHQRPGCGPETLATKVCQGDLLGVLLHVFNSVNSVTVLDVHLRAADTELVSLCSYNFSPVITFRVNLTLVVCFEQELQRYYRPVSG